MMEGVVGNSKGLIGVIEVHIHHARDIHNICIYHKQDVYAKLCLTDDPKTTVSTQIVNGGGKNPVFDEKLRLDVRSIDSSLKCEIWMLSRVRNYLEDQLLGIALVPLSDVLVEKGKLVREFSLSSSDLFHSPSGFVELTLTYIGALPEVLEVPKSSSSLAVSASAKDLEVPNSIPENLDKFEFPDPKIVNENERMVSEYLWIPSANLNSQSSESFEVPQNGELISSDIGVDVLEKLATDGDDKIVISKIETPSSSVSINGSPSISGPTSTQSVCDILAASKCLNQDVVSPLEEKTEDVGLPFSTFSQQLISASVEQDQKVVQQEIVDIYNKSMQQFTEALAKMKLPMDIQNESTSSGNTDSDAKVKSSPKDNGPSSRVFYGSRAFF